MKVFINLSLPVLALLFSTAGFCYEHDAADQFRRTCYAKGVTYAVKGDFKAAKEQFDKALKFDPFYESAKRALKVIEDAFIDGTSTKN